MTNIDPPFEMLATAAYHGERVAARRLAARSHITMSQALAQVLTTAASRDGLADLSELLAVRAQARQREEERRTSRRAQQAHELALRQAQKTPPPDRWRGWFDGSAHPNPGRIGIGALLCGPHGERVEISRRAGHGNSSVAEYLALTALLAAAVDAGAHNLLLYGDSQVVINDVHAGMTENQAPAGARTASTARGLEDYRARVLALMQQTATSHLQWIPRHRNSEADRLSQQAIDHMAEEP
ncbi:RNase HI-like protein [Duganella sp. Leaf126]|uniref:reverse transcriptase-like protein n=1 Tax=Duganella sp. Leaf126 TaxID=1736266 RepID=UPI0006F3A8A2|nr:reverse transcriptase-like protein [Duganella sp. Leaf126]KQQ40243.1 RNase HI-like protein [Duganella sp. Leaf126]